MRALQHGSTHEEESACDQGSLFCWARCMDLLDYNLTEELCQEQKLGLKCINPREQISSCENMVISPRVSEYYRRSETVSGNSTKGCLELFLVGVGTIHDRTGTTDTNMDNTRTGEGSFWTEEDEEDDDVGAGHGGDSDHHEDNNQHHNDDDSGGPANNNNMLFQPILISILLAVMSLQLH